MILMKRAKKNLIFQSPTHVYYTYSLNQADVKYGKNALLSEIFRIYMYIFEGKNALYQKCSEYTSIYLGAQTKKPYFFHNVFVEVCIFIEPWACEVSLSIINNE